MEKKKKKLKKNLRKKLKFKKRDEKKTKNSEVVYAADKSEEIFNLNNGQENHGDKDSLYNDQGNNVNSSEKKEQEKNDEEKHNMSTSSNSIKDELDEFNDLSDFRPESQEQQEEPSSIIVRSISINNPNNNLDNFMINNAGDQQSDWDEESHDNNINIFNNENDITQNGTNQEFN